MLLRIFVLLSNASNSSQEQSQFASKAYGYAVTLLHGSLLAVNNAPTSGASPMSA